MIIPDVNLLLYASLTAFPQHPQAEAWWSAALSDPGREVGLPPVTLFGFLRLSTDRRMFTVPMSVDDAVTRIESWLARPQVRFLPAGPRHLELAFGLLRQLGTAGRLTTDIQLAAHALENQAELHSNDQDFNRFPELRWVNPLREKR